MIVGIPKEIKNEERRVGMVPSSVRELVGHGHSVMVERHAGTGVGADDESYIRAGATICDTAYDIFASADMVVKVLGGGEPLASFRMNASNPTADLAVRVPGTTLSIEILDSGGGPIMDDIDLQGAVLFETQ